MILLQKERRGKGDREPLHNAHILKRIKCNQLPCLNKMETGHQRFWSN